MHLSAGWVALVADGLGVLRQPLDEGLKLLLELGEHGLDISFDFLSHLSDHGLHAGSDSPVEANMTKQSYFKFQKKKKFSHTTHLL